MEKHLCSTIKCFHCLNYKKNCFIECRNEIFIQETNKAAFKWCVTLYLTCLDILVSFFLNDCQLSLVSFITKCSAWRILQTMPQGSVQNKANTQERAQENIFLIIFIIINFHVEKKICFVLQRLLHLLAVRAAANKKLKIWKIRKSKLQSKMECVCVDWNSFGGKSFTFRNDVNTGGRNKILKNIFAMQILMSSFRHHFFVCL